MDPKQIVTQHEASRQLKAQNTMGYIRRRPEASCGATANNRPAPAAPQDSEERKHTAFGDVRTRYRNAIHRWQVLENEALQAIDRACAACLECDGAKREYVEALKKELAAHTA